MEKKFQIPSAIPSIMMFCVLLVIIYPATQRSAWLDETMFMANFPLDNFLDIFQPLPRYSQAGTPLFSAITSSLSELSTAYLRYIVFIVTLGGTLLSLGFFKSGLIQSAIKALAILSLTTLLVYSTELKHYAFEILGTAIAIGWVLRKDSHSELSIFDIGILVFSSFLGISTLVISSIALSVYMLDRFFLTKKTSLQSVLLGLVFLIATLANYLVIRTVSSIQIRAAPDVYGASGVEGAVAFLQNTYSAIGGVSITPALFVALAVLAWNTHTPKVRRYLIFTGLVFLAFSILAMLGQYPVNSIRHVAWSSAFVLAVFFLFLEHLPPKGIHKVILVLILLASFLSPVASNVGRFFSKETVFEKTAFGKAENEPAASWLANQEAASVGLWIGGQAAIEFYRRHFPGLNKHAYFGVRNKESAIPVDLGHLSHEDRFNKIEAMRNQPGDGARSVYYRIINDYHPMAKSLISEAPKGENFLIFSSHVRYEANSGWGKSRYTALIDVLEAQGCTYEPALILRGAFVMDVNCPD